MKEQHNILMVEDSEDDTLLIMRQVEKGNFDVQFERVETEESFISALELKEWDIILCDYKLPTFNGIEALNILKKRGYDIPFIFVSGTMGEERAIEAMKHGAHDYVMKGNLKRLVPAIERELLEAKNRREKKQSDEKIRKNDILFKKLSSNVPGMIYQFTRRPDGTYYVPITTEGIKNIFGCSPEDVIDDFAPIGKVIHPDDSERVFRDIKYSAKHLSPFHCEFRVQIPDKPIQWILSRATPEQCADGTVTWYGFCTSITEIKQAEVALLQTQKMESIGVLAGGIAHDFNNLLNAMMGNVSLAKMRLPIDHPAMRNLERTMAAMERAETLTKQMLAYSGKGKFQILTIDVGAMVQEHISLFESSLPKNVKIQTTISQTPVYIKGDPGQIEQIVMNLIINAGDASGEKQGVVSVMVTEISMTEKELLPFGTLMNSTLIGGKYALLQVSDNGSGMSKEILEKIFDPFFTTKIIGRGLGLSAVLGIIRGHNGGITIDSTEGVGTTFRVLLPLASAPVVVNDQSLKKTDFQESKQKTILVIDDEEYVVDMVHDILETGKYQSLSATDSVAGVTMYEEQWREIDAVILDYSMPKMHGKEVLIELRKINPNVKVVMSSGYSEEELAHLMGDVKPIVIIQKPHTADALLSLISKVLEMK